MTCEVPEWVDRSNPLSAFDDTSTPGHLKKASSAYLHHQRQWQHPHLQQHHRSVLHTSSVSAFVPITSDDMVNSVTLRGAQGEDGTKSSDRMECSAVNVLNSVESMTAAHGQEDEMLSWLRYPLEDSLDRSFCSNIFGELINPRIQLVKDVYLHQSMKDSGISHVPGTECNDGSDVCYQEIKPAAGGIGSAMKSDAAMALGAGRAAGLLSQIGSEAFSGVRTHSTPCGMHRQSSFPSIESASNHSKAAQLAPATPSGFNFSLFSRPLATTVDNLRVVGAASGPTNTNRARQPLAKDYELPCELYDVDSDRNLSASMPSVHQLIKVSAHGAEERVGDTFQNWCSQPSLAGRQFSQRHSETAEVDSRASCVSATETSFEALEAAGTEASPSCLSGSSFEKVAQDVITTSEKFVSSAEHLEHQDVEDAQANARKPPPGPRAVKRSRAAEVHNESEKKRRNKINVRLKLLQSLIPNSNKTDKASVLDEAIEYTKMLQAQVQFMSMKSGLLFPNMVHSGVQCLPMEQVAAISHLGMGMGVPVGMNVDIGIGIPVPIPVPSSNPVNGIGGGIEVAAATCAGAGASIYTSPMMLQPLSQPGVGSHLFHKRSCSPVYDVSCSLPMASEPLRMNTTQQPLQPVLMNVRMNGDLYSASQC